MRYTNDRSRSKLHTTGNIDSEEAFIETCVCIGLIYIAVLGVLAFSLTVFASSTRKQTQQIEAFLTHLHHTRHIEFALYQTDRSTDRKSFTIQRDNHTRIDKVHGRVLPQVSSRSGQLRFDGWVSWTRTTRNASKEEVVYTEDLFYADGRGIRQTRCESPHCNQLNANDSAAQECLQSNETIGWPPLSALEASLLDSAMTSSVSQKLSTCPTSNPIQVRFHQQAYLVCPQDIMKLSSSYVDGSPKAWKAIQDILRQNQSPDNDTTPSNLSFYQKELPVYSHKLLLHLTMQLLDKCQTESKASEKLRARIRIAQEKELSWLLAKIPRSCPYIEAPFTTEQAPSLLSVLLAFNNTQTNL
uniref:AlNc14C31G2882 protein n=1 Tax=Albugo laibachii Nc14 TaxID=890382 RepID=F0W7S9_9STRA|nr:AlNc14C31G2882 [Albugo laibachii Nc14]|eukprot:CCA17181.1 AlNc14C31G2882 [Albugo laibachii Nc14]